MRAGVCTISFEHESLQRAVAIAREAGAEGIEVWGKPPHTAHPRDPKELASIAGLAREAGLEICCYGSYFRFGAQIEIEGYRLEWQEELVIAAGLGTNTVRVWLGPRDFEKTPAAEVARILDHLREGAAQAAAAGVTIVLERHGNTLTNRWRGTGDLLGGLSLSNVGLCYQVVGPSTEQEIRDEVERDFSELLPLSAHSHLHNYRMTPGGMQRCHLDAGLIDYRAFAARAKACDYQGYGMVEFLPQLLDTSDPVASLRRDLQLIASL